MRSVYRCEGLENWTSAARYQVPSSLFSVLGFMGQDADLEQARWRAGLWAALIDTYLCHLDGTEKANGWTVYRCHDVEGVLGFAECRGTVTDYIEREGLFEHVERTRHLLLPVTYGAAMLPSDEVIRLLSKA